MERGGGGAASKVKLDLGKCRGGVARNGATTQYYRNPLQICGVGGANSEG